MTSTTNMSQFVYELQNEICSQLETADSIEFREDTWKRDGGGGGRTRVIENGETFEKGGVNVSEVFGTISDKEVPMFQLLLKQQGIDHESLENASFYATGLSLVIHPKNPFVPTTHANYRYFEMTTETQNIWWYGGGADLTPYYFDRNDAVHFHRIHKQACDQHDPTYYETFKSKCDTYFYLPHRNETRGIGGIFFDYLNNDTKEDTHAFVKTCGEAFIPAYLPIVEAKKSLTFTEEQRYWQEIRRGRYAEFNLVYDRGTQFGLKTNGRIESILMSLPPQTRWVYDYHPKEGSQEEELLKVLSSPQHYV